MKTYTLFFFGLFLSLQLMSQEHDLKKYGMAEDDRNRLHQLEVGASAPEIKTENFQLSTSVENGPVVLIFYRGYWCPYCSQHLEAFQDELQKFTDLGATVVAVTPEGGEGIDKTREKSGWSGTIVHDADRSIMADYGVLFKVTQEYDRKINTKLFADIAKTNESDDSFLPIPATYIIDSDMTITYAHYDPNYKNRSDVDAVINALKGLK